MTWQNGMRLWIGPDNEMIDLDRVDLPHSLCVVEDPALFGLDPAPVARHMEMVNSPDAEMDFDFDTVIVMAEMNGWVRVSRDASSSGQAAVSAACFKDARRAVAFLSELAPGFTGVDIEIERLVGEHVEREYSSLSPEDTIRFLKSGAIRDVRRYTTQVGDVSLLDAASSGKEFAL